MNNDLFPQKRINNNRFQIVVINSFISHTVLIACLDVILCC